MKKIYSLLAMAICGMTLANAANGIVSFQIDQNLGTGDPDLLEGETAPVTASYEDGVLTISQMMYGFKAVDFTIDMETGDAVASDQVAVIEGSDTFYYYDVESSEKELIGKITNLGSEKCELVLQPWGPGDYFSGLGVYFTVAFYNTVFTFDFAIPGLGAEVAAPVLEIASVDYEAVNSDYGMFMDFTVWVTAENLPEGSEVTVYYKGPNDNDFKTATENTDGTYGFSIYGLEEDKDYSVEIYAQAGAMTSETETIEFKFEETGIDSITGYDSSSRFFNLKGVEVKNPQPGEMYIKLNKGNAKKVLIK